MIKTDNIDGIGAATITLTYDPVIVSLDSVSGGDLGAVTHNDINGTVTMIAYSATACPTGSVKFADIRFCPVRSGCSILDIEVIELNDCNVNAMMPDAVKDGEFCVIGTSSNGTAISIRSATTQPDSTITIPVSITNTTNISRISFNLLYNSSVVTVSGVSANESFAGSSIIPYIDNINGITSIVLTHANLISISAETPVIDITFNIAGTPGSSTSLDLKNVEFSDSEFNLFTPAVVTDGQITVGIKGDFNGNDRVDIGDVAKVAFMVAGKVQEDMNADFNNNGRVDIGDAAKIAFYLAGKVSEL